MTHAERLEAHATRVAAELAALARKPPPAPERPRKPVKVTPQPVKVRAKPEPAPKVKPPLGGPCACGGFKSPVNNRCYQCKGPPKGVRPGSFRDARRQRSEASSCPKCGSPLSAWNRCGTCAGRATSATWARRRAVKDGGDNGVVVRESHRPLRD